jgi:CRP/FNR family transcriptional regulator, cyclic AMP receptor protein
MPAAYGLEIVDNCLQCPYRPHHLFCNLPPEAVKSLAAITAPASYPRGAVLFVEGQVSRGIYILCAGRAKLSTSVATGKTLILKFAEAGEVLGLASTICSKPYEGRAEVLEPTQANFIARNDFLEFLRMHGEAALRVARQLSEAYQSAISEARSMSLSSCASQKLGRFLLDWCEGDGKKKDEVITRLTLTHEEIAQSIGTSRETVSRLLSDFRRKRLIRLQGSALILTDKAALRSSAVY